MTQMTLAPKRRWSFSLRTLFVVVTVVGFSLGYQLDWMRQRGAFIDEETYRFVHATRAELPASAFTSINRVPAPAMLWLFPNEGVEYLSIIVQGSEGDQLTAQDMERRARGRTLFPEANINFSYVETFHDRVIDKPVRP
jgi:hypothetical protein